jgi:hypothetical protein
MNGTQENTIETLVGMWEIQEALLQQYRTIFITMQSIFIAVAAAILQGTPLSGQPAKLQAHLAEAILFGNGPWIPMLLLTALAAYTLRKLWLPICKARGKTVYLIQYLILKAEAGTVIMSPLKTIKGFHDNEHPEIEQDPVYRALDGGETRKKMETQLPHMFIAAWGFLWLTLLLQYFYVAVFPR